MQRRSRAQSGIRLPAPPDADGQTQLVCGLPSGDDFGDVHARAHRPADHTPGTYIHPVWGMRLHVPTWPNYPPQRAPDRGLATIVRAHRRRHRLARGRTLGDLLPLDQTFCPGPWPARCRPDSAFGSARARTQRCRPRTRARSAPRRSWCLTRSRQGSEPLYLCSIEMGGRLPGKENTLHFLWLSDSAARAPPVWGRDRAAACGRLACYRAGGTVNHEGRPGA